MQRDIYQNVFSRVLIGEEQAINREITYRKLTASGTYLWHRAENSRSRSRSRTQTQRKNDASYGIETNSQ